MAFQAKHCTYTYNCSEVNGEIERLNSSGDDGQDLEAIFGRICALDKCLGKIRSAQVKSANQKAEKNPSDEIPQINEKPKIGIKSSLVHRNPLYRP